uniref:Methyltransferase type 11 domain-containing protein n=1 Tax=Florenciella parvula TaxID=236787 RepID=A0A7S2FRJ3_9STRA
MSPFYLDKSRKNDAYWRQRYAGTNGGAEPPAARLVQANAEKLPFEDASFDAVTCVYLFHEMPAEARANAAAEMARVVKPGGTVVFTDSIQRGDRPALDEGLDKFENLNEPHYPSYIRSDVPKYFTDAGLVCGDKSVASTSKTLSFTKPL